MKKTFGRVEPGRPLVARTLNRPIAEVERASGISVAAPLAMAHTPAGPHIYSAARREFWARIIGPYDPATGAHPYQRLIETPNGGWRLGYQGFVAFEDNGNKNNLTGANVRMRWTAANDYRFQLGSCPPPPAGP
jgi:hypothetical protein